MAHKTIWEDEGIYWQFYENVSFDEVKKAADEAYNDNRFDDIKYFIWDMTGTKNLIMKEEDAEYPAAVSYGASTYKTSMRGALIANDIHVRNILQLYINTSSSLKNPWELRLFKNIKDAREWVSS